MKPEKRLKMNWYRCNHIVTIFLFLLLHQIVAATDQIMPKQGVGDEGAASENTKSKLNTKVGGDSGGLKAAKNAMSENEMVGNPVHSAQAASRNLNESVVAITEKPVPSADHVKNDQHANNQPLKSNLPEDEMHSELSQMNDLDFPDTYTAVFYVLVGITSSAILLLILRVYRLRLSRAERKYGVQGDRTNQELTPLPLAAIEDVNSDEDDHTVFEVHRQNIRIL